MQNFLEEAPTGKQSAGILANTVMQVTVLGRVYNMSDLI